MLFPTVLVYVVEASAEGQWSSTGPSPAAFGAEGSPPAPVSAEMPTAGSLNSPVLFSSDISEGFIINIVAFCL